jgi:glycosyltransferase involved in cell wall biosynthesis
MNILIPIYEIQDYGGITGHTELLIRGLKEHGHEVDLVILRNNDQPSYARKSTGPKGSYKSATGGEVHLLSGWYGVPVASYGTVERAKDFVEWAGAYDLIIWDLPCPYNNEGAWRELYQVEVPQVAVIHDAHYERAYKHLDDVVDNLCFLAPVNESAYGALNSWPGERVLINNGHELLPWKEQTPWQNRRKRAVCAHVWKAWKQMHRMVEAQPLSRSTIVMGGDGIEGRYMRSKEKCKPKYKGMWDRFTGIYRGVMTPEELFAEYQQARIMVDLSWNERFASYGCHYNRSIVEGANNGCVPLVTEEFFAGSRVFPEGTYYSIKKDASAAELAYLIDAIMEADDVEIHSMLFDLRCILTDHFDYRKTCLQYLTPITG